MDAMEAQLRETYASWDTEELMQHSARGGLSETAERVLAEELARREVSPATIEATRTHLAKASAQSEELRLRLAPVLIRLVAGAIDHIGVLVAITAVNFGVFVTTPKAVADFIGWVSILLWIAYIFFKDGFDGQSIGKRILRIRVVDKQSGEPCTLPKSFLRGLVGLLGLIDLVFVFGTNRQRLADHAANTLVVRA